MEPTGKWKKIASLFTNLTALLSPVSLMPLVPHYSLQFLSISSLISVFYSLIFFFQFLVDHVFDESCTNSKVYELLTKDLILAAVDGFNGMIY